MSVRIRGDQSKIRGLQKPSLPRKKWTTEERKRHIGSVVSDYCSDADARATLSDLVAVATHPFSGGYFHLINTEKSNSILAFDCITWIHLLFQTNRNEKNDESYECVRTIFKKANYVTEELESYIEKRHGKALEKYQIRRIIRHAKYSYDMTHEEYGIVNLADIDFTEGELLGKGALGTVKRKKMNDSDIVMKNLNNPVPIRLNSEGKLLRTHEVAASWLDTREDGILAPTSYIVCEKNRNRPDQFFLVPSGKNFRHWAQKRLQLTNPPELNIVSLVIPEAQGKTIFEIFQSESSLTPNDLESFSTGLINLLKKLACRGFLHGDLHDGNIFFAPEAKPPSVQLVDTGLLVKITEVPSQVQETLFDPDFCNPLISHPMLLGGCPVGFEQDLFSTGLIILMADLRFRKGLQEYDNFYGILSNHQDKTLDSFQSMYLDHMEYRKKIQKNFSKPTERKEALFLEDERYIQQVSQSACYLQYQHKLFEIIDLFYNQKPDPATPASRAIRCIEESFKLCTKDRANYPKINRHEYSEILQGILAIEKSKES